MAALLSAALAALQSVPPALQPGPAGALAALAALTALAAVAWAARWTWALRHQRRLAAALPGRPAWLLLGNLPEIGLSQRGLFRSMMRFAGGCGGGVPVMRFWIGPFLYVGIKHPADLEAILSSGKYIDKPLVYRLLEPWIGRGLITSSGDRWRAHRRLIQPAFHPKMLEQFVPVFSRQTDTFLQRLEKHAGGPAFDIQPLASLLTLDIICETAMGVDLGAQLNSDSDYVRANKAAGECLVQRALAPWLYPRWLFRLSPLGRRASGYLRTVHAARDRVVQQRRRELEALGPGLTAEELGGKRRLAFLDLLLLSARAGASLTDRDIKDEVDTFMMAGHDTSAILVTFTLFLLSRHPAVQDQLVQELREQLGPGPRPQLDCAALARLPALDRVLKEALRLFPPASAFFRTLRADVRLPSCGLTLPAGCTVAISPHFTHRDPALFPDPDRFDPDRWLPENSRGRHPYSFIPFSAGPRTCVGKHYSLLESKLIVAKTLWSFRVLEDPECPRPRLAWAVTVKPLTAVRVRLQARDAPEPGPAPLQASAAASVPEPTADSTIDSPQGYKENQQVTNEPLETAARSAKAPTHSSVTPEVIGISPKGTPETPRTSEETAGALETSRNMPETAEKLTSAAVKLLQ